MLWNSKKKKKKNIIMTTWRALSGCRENIGVEKDGWGHIRRLDRKGTIFITRNGMFNFLIHCEENVLTSESIYDFMAIE